jgi:polyferredoxin
MAKKEKYTPQDLDARLKFIIGITLGGVLFITIGAQAENDKMFFNVLSSIATFITGALAGLMVGAKGTGEAAESVTEETTEY